MKDPLVSVKMLTYNHAPYIAQAIEGVLQQKTNFPFELVIGEDCSTDGTREIVFEYQKKYPDIIRVITSEQNVGMTKNGYRAEKACRGKYVAYCEGDDYWHHPYKLQKQVDYMETHPECGLICSDYDIYTPRTTKRIQNFNRQARGKFPSNPDITDVLTQCPISTCTVVARKALLDKITSEDPVLYQSGRFLLGDVPRWAEISYISQIAYLDESLATHNFLVESATQSRDPRKILRFWKSSRELHLYLVDKYNLSPALRQMYEESWCKYSLSLAFYERDARLAKEVRKRKKKFTALEWLTYWGSRNVLLNYALRIMNYPRRIVIKALGRDPV